MDGSVNVWVNLRKSRGDGDWGLIGMHRMGFKMYAGISGGRCRE
jgi:hypothetical protein